MQILDTQIISYAYKGSYDGQVAGQSIASTTAKEFLLVQGAERTRANYYVPFPKNMLHYAIASLIPLKRNHPFPKRVTDQILIDFGQLHPPIVEFGNFALAQTINLKAKGIFHEAIRFLDKEKRKIILERFDFLLGQDINCLPLNRSSVEIGLELFEAFTSRYNTKGNVKNTINDVFILAIAITSSATLITQDSLLHRFASELFDAVTEERNGSLVIKFEKEKEARRHILRESKGYINRGWQVRVRNYKGW